MTGTPATPRTLSLRASGAPGRAVRLLVGACLALTVAAPPASGSAASTAPTLTRQGVTATVALDCLLQPFRSGFRYEATATMVAARSAEAGPDVQLSVAFSDLPGISPAQIDDGRMTIAVVGKADGTKFRLKGTSQVTSAPKLEIPMPPMSGQIVSAADSLYVEVSEFQLAFEEMMGLTITATCVPTVSGGLGIVTVGSGSIDAEIAMASQKRDEADARPATSDDDSDDSFPMVVLWGLGAAGLALMIWLARRRLQRT